MRPDMASESWRSAVRPAAWKALAPTGRRVLYEALHTSC